MAYLDILVFLILEQRANFSCHYYLTLDEAKQGFALATFGKKKFSQYLTPLVSIGIIIWGISLGWSGVGKYYILLGLFFLVLQLLLRWLFLPAMFRRQYQRMNFANTEHGIELYQDYLLITIAEQQHQFKFDEIVKFRQGDLVYLLELNNKTMMLISKQAVQATGKQDFFESIFQRYL